MPVVAAVTVIAHSGIKFSWYISILFIVPLSALLACITNTILFTYFSDMNTAEIAAVQQFFQTQSSNLSIYVMTLVGLQVSNS
jgi:hypothetical protein